MAWTILYTHSAAQSIRKLDPQVRSRVRLAVQKLAEEPQRGKPLQLTLKGLRSWRTGDFRIVYRAVESRLEILVIALGHRRDVYSKLRHALE
ncbi:MAG TPA: type II toxin-antitoxin system RelE/ParE family toxin [Acidobacteriota bacterium]|jgi:mRNA interferase RelE/StbE